jgi:hypothetical protein
MYIVQTSDPSNYIQLYLIKYILIWYDGPINTFRATPLFVSIILSMGSQRDVSILADQ